MIGVTTICRLITLLGSFRKKALSKKKKKKLLRKQSPTKTKHFCKRDLALESACV